jgi:hypothetical protein
MELNPSDGAPHFLLPELLEREEHASEATLEWRAAVQLDNDPPVVSLFDKTLRNSSLPAAKRAVSEILIERLAAKAKTNFRDRN